MRHKPKYNNLRLKHVDSNGLESTFQCDEVTASKKISELINMPIQDAGSRYITDSDLVFSIDDKIIVCDNTKRIIDIPEITPKADNNSRRGRYRKDKVLITT